MISDYQFYFDREGQPIDMETFARLHADYDYKVVEQTTLPNGRLVSTVWLGINYAFMAGPPLIFETMVFSLPTALSDEVACHRYGTLGMAKESHERLCRYWRTRPNKRMKRRVVKKKVSRVERSFALRMKRARNNPWRTTCR